MLQRIVPKSADQLYAVFMNMDAASVKHELQKRARREKAGDLAWFFKTGPGQYGEGDEFIGVVVPDIRIVAKAHKALPLDQCQALLDSPIHEHRLCALIILMLQFPRATEVEKKNIYDIYLKNVHEYRINNWDLVDVTCRDIVGAYLWQRDRGVLLKLAKSDNLWERRVAAVSTFYFLAHGDPSTSLEVAELLLHDTHDLIHKAVGWMLREMGKRVDRALLLEFLDQHAHEMPRTMLRYSIEHLLREQRDHYMHAKARASH